MHNLTAPFNYSYVLLDFRYDLSHSYIITYSFVLCNDINSGAVLGAKSVISLCPE